MFYLATLVEKKSICYHNINSMFYHATCMHTLCLRGDGVFLGGGRIQVLASQLLLVDEVMKAGKQMGSAPPGGPEGMME